MSSPPSYRSPRRCCAWVGWAAAGEFRQRARGRQAVLSLARTAASDQPCAYLAFLQDVPQQREVLSGEVPKRLDLPAVNEGYQVEVIQLQRERRRTVTKVTTERADGGTSAWDLTHQPQLSRLCCKGLPAVVFNPHPSWAESSRNLPVRDALTHKATAPQSIISGQIGFCPGISSRGQLHPNR